MQAARAYDQAALELRGPGTVTNFPSADYYDSATGKLLPKEVSGRRAAGKGVAGVAGGSGGARHDLDCWLWICRSTVH